MKRRIFLAGMALPLWSTALAQTAGTPVRSSRAVKALRVISKERRRALDENVAKKTTTELNGLIPEISDIEVFNTAASERPRKALRIIAWNTERGRYWRDGVRLIQETPALRDPDIILLGEMDLGMARSSNQHTTREMAAALRMNFAYGVEFLEFTGGEPQERIDYPGENQMGYHGNAILSKYPLHNVRMLRFPGIEKWYAGKEYGASQSEQEQKRLGGRMALFATIKLGRDVTVVATHLESSARDSATRKTQMEMLLGDLKTYSRGGPVIMGGDLNGAPDEPMFASVKQAGFILSDTNEMSGGTLQRIADGKIVLGRSYIDYVLVRGVSVIRDATSPKVVMAAYPSDAQGKILADHAIVTARIELPWIA
ncbi:MAG: endonuclease/exonuclease/phosphatase family protein [Acidobacteriota bacterium]